MPDNLAPPSANAADHRPHQAGEARGYKWGLSVVSKIEWLIDTGAQISVVTKSKGALFDLLPIAGSASATTGGGGILIKSGLDMAFEIFDGAGLAKPVVGTLDVGVKPDDNGSEILGVDQLEKAGAVVEWDPSAGLGRLKEP